MSRRLKMVVENSLLRPRWRGWPTLRRDIVIHGQSRRRHGWIYLRPPLGITTELFGRLGAGVVPFPWGRISLSIRISWRLTNGMIEAAMWGRAIAPVEETHGRIMSYWIYRRYPDGRVVVRAIDASGRTLKRRVRLRAVHASIWDMGYVEGSGMNHPDVVSKAPIVRAARTCGKI